MGDTETLELFKSIENSRGRIRELKDNISIKRKTVDDLQARQDRNLEVAMNVNAVKRLEEESGALKLLRPYLEVKKKRGEYNKENCRKKEVKKRWDEQLEILNNVELKLNDFEKEKENFKRQECEAKKERDERFKAILEDKTANIECEIEAISRSIANIDNKIRFA